MAGAGGGTLLTFRARGSSIDGMPTTVFGESCLRGSESFKRLTAVFGSWAAAIRGLPSTSVADDLAAGTGAGDGSAAIG